MNPIVMQIILAVLIIAALVMGGLSVKTWRAWHVVGGFLVFLTAVGYLVLVTMSLKARRVWLKELARLETQYVRLLDEQKKLTYGDLASLAPERDNLHSLTHRLHRLTLARGRVWRGCTPDSVAPDGTISLTIPSAAAGSPHQLPANFVVYAFREVDTPEGWKVPVTYLGEFQVVAATETTVQLRQALAAPAIMAAGNTIDYQAAFITGASWSLYEILPADDHTVFTDPEELPNLATPGEPVFGKPNPEEVQRVLQTVLQYAPVQPSPQAIQEILTAYLRDGSRAEPSDPPERQYVKVEFIKAYSEKVDSETSQSVLSSRFFDAQGQAQVGFLQRGEGGTVSMPAGAIALLPKAQADQLINNGTCKSIEPVYVRPLVDYTFAFHDLFDRWVDTRTQIAMYTMNKQKLEQLNAHLTTVIRDKQEERRKLTEDLSYLTRERDFLGNLRTALEQQRNQLLSQLSGLYRANLVMEQEIAELEQLVFEHVQQAAQSALSSP